MGKEFSSGERGGGGGEEYSLEGEGGGLFVGEREREGGLFVGGRGGGRTFRWWRREREKESYRGEGEEEFSMEEHEDIGSCDGCLEFLVILVSSRGCIFWFKCLFGSSWLESV